MTIRRVTSPDVPEPPPERWSNCLVSGGIAYVSGMTARGTDPAQLAKMDEYEQAKLIFNKSKDMVETARRFYREINMRAMKLLSPGGTLITCSCSNHIHEPDFENILVAAAAEAQTAMVLLEKRRQARDHPALLGAPETHYLKCAVLQRMPS